MLVREFAEKHYLCDEGVDMMAPFLDRTVKEWWHNEDEVAMGSWLFWLLVHAPADPRKIAKCACDCARPILEYFPDHPLLKQAFDATEAWSNGSGSSQDALVLGEEARKLEHDRSLPNAAHLAHQVAREITELTKDSLKRAQRDLCFFGGLHESRWNVLQGRRSPALQRPSEPPLAGTKSNRRSPPILPSPDPRPASEEEVVSATESILSNFDELSRSMDEALAKQEAVLKEFGVSFQGINNYVASLGSSVQQVVKDNADFDLEEEPAKTSTNRSETQSTHDLSLEAATTQQTWRS